MKKLNKAGFTIIELMIASMVFTTVLLLCMEGITKIVKVYVKNASVTRTSEFTKSFIESISEQVKYGSSAPLVDDNAENTNIQYLCISGNAYRLELNKKGSDAIKKVSAANCADYNIESTYTTATGVAPANTRVLSFFVAFNGSDIWDISMRVALGDDDLLVVGDENTPISSDNYPEARCKSGISGSEYCAVIELSTVASRRLQ